jgi:hypothetical protein
MYASKDSIWRRILKNFRKSDGYDSSWAHKKILDQNQRPSLTLLTFFSPSQPHTTRSSQRAAGSRMDTRSYSWPLGARLAGARVRQGRARLRRARQPGCPYVAQGQRQGGGGRKQRQQPAVAWPRVMEARAQLAAAAAAPARGPYPRYGGGPWMHAAAPWHQHGPALRRQWRPAWAPGASNPLVA